MLTISPNQFFNALKQASCAVISEEDNINALNFFPVSDKDTGTNLSITLAPMSQVQDNFTQFSNMLNRSASLVFENARGNSGMILSIWFAGIQSFTTNKLSITFHEVLKIFQLGKNHLINNMDTIVPGTMVSFFSDLPDKLAKMKSMDEVASHIEALVQATRTQNKVQKAHHAVDAGAFALSVFCKTFFQTLITKNMADTKPSLQATPVPTHHTETLTEAPEYRYCTEAFIRYYGTHAPDFKALLSPFGNCFLVAEHDGEVHFHIHTNKPQQLFRTLYQYGQIKKPKVEDMQRQYQAAQDDKEFVIVTDSSANLDQMLIEKHGLHVLPLNVQFDKHQALDGLSISTEYLVENISQCSTHPNTASPSIAFCQQFLGYLSKHYKQVLVITLSSAMSSTYKVIQKASQALDNVTVFDSKTNSGAQGFLVHKAANMAAQKKDIKTITSSLKAYREQVSLFVAVNSIEAMINSGRLSGIKAKILKQLNPKLIVSINRKGQGCVRRKLLRKHVLLDKLIQEVMGKHRKKPIRQYSILHVNNIKQAQVVADKLSKMLGFSPQFIQPTSTSIAIHAGTDSVAVALSQMDP